MKRLLLLLQLLLDQGPLLGLCLRRWQQLLQRLLWLWLHLC
jgi:hypothetical protein